MTRHPLVLTFALVATVQGAAAQAPPTATTPPKPTATAAADDCAPNAKSAMRRPNSEPGTTTGQAAEPLGDKLARSDGVLCPPLGVDPEIRAPTPSGGQYAGDSAAWKPRRQPGRPAEIAREFRRVHVGSSFA